MTDQFDAIVIGSGLGGLTAGAFCARRGHRVLVLERQRTFGGAATMFRRPGLLVEAGLHGIDGLDRWDPKTRMFANLGIDEAVEFVRLPELFAVRHPLLGDDFVLPDGRAAATAAAIERFPVHAKAIEKFFKTICDIRQRTSKLALDGRSPLFWLLFGPWLPFWAWPLIKHERTTVSQLLGELFGDDEAVKFALCANIGYYGADPRTLSLLYFSAGQASFLAGGAHYPRGGSRAITGYLTGQIEAHGGTLLAQREVERILVEDGRAVGVIHRDRTREEDQREARARVLFGSAAPAQLARMLPAELRQGFAEPYAAHHPATSLWCVYLGLDRPPSELGLDFYSTFVFPEWMTALDQYPEGGALMAAPPAGRTPAYVMVDYARIDAGLAEEGRHLMVLCGIDRLENWDALEEAVYREKKAAWLEAIVADLRRQVPGIGPHIVHQEMATARTMRRYLGTPGGAVYGFAQEPFSAGRHRPSCDTSIANLLLASSFAQPGGGCTGALMTGERASTVVFRRKTLER